MRARTIAHLWVAVVTTSCSAGASAPPPQAEATKVASMAEPAAEPAAQAQEDPAPQCPQASGLCLSVLPTDAVVRVGRRNLGTVESLGPEGARFIELEPGIHRVTLRRDGFATWRTEVTVGASAETIAVELQANEAP